MSAAAAVELVRRGLHALRRSAMWWGLGIVGLALVTVGSWPSLEGSEALEGFDDMGTLLEAFGASDIGTPAGYLDGQMYALMLPLLLSGMAVAHVTGLTSGDEDAGRLELLHALPVSRRSVWMSRWTSALLTLLMVAATVTVLMAVTRPVFSLDEVSAGRIIEAGVGCAVLAAFHAAVAYAAGGVGASRGSAVGIALLVLVAGYVMSFLLPLSDTLTGFQEASPWYWAMGQQPVSDGVEPWRVIAVVGATAALVVAGTAAVERRDIRSA